MKLMTRIKCRLHLLRWALRTCARRSRIRREAGLRRLRQALGFKMAFLPLSSDKPKPVQPISRLCGVSECGILPPVDFSTNWKYYILMSVEVRCCVILAHRLVFFQLGGS